MENLRTEVPGKMNEIYLQNNLKNGSNGDDVKYFQEHLKKLGYYTGNIDGVFGALTETATRDFQSDYKLQVDGIIGPITQAKINEIDSSETIFHLGSTDVEVKTLQRQLKLLNLYPGNIDGIFGPITDSGVKSFQKNNGLVQDGEAGVKTKNSLKERLLAENNNIGNRDSSGNVLETIGNAGKDLFGNEPDQNREKKEATNNAPAGTVTKTDGTRNTYVSEEQLNKLEWHDVNANMVNELNKSLEKYDITTTQRIRHFISQCAAETDAGRTKIEEKPQSNYKGGLKYKGAGYLQLTHIDNYQRFAKEMNDPKIVEEGVNYVAEVYPWTSAAYHWHATKMNELCDKGANVFTVSQMVNCGRTYNCNPNGLEKRQKYYDACTKIFV